MRISKFKLNLAMAEIGFNFVMLAKESGISRATLSAINNGKQCKPEVLFQIAKALNVKAESLLEGGNLK